MPSAVHRRTPSRQIRRMLRAQWRDAQVLFQESHMALLLFAALILGGATILRFFYSDPHTGETVGFAEALYATFALIFFESVLAFPSQWYLQLLYFLIPIFGLFIVADGVIRFGVALTNKQERGQKWQAAMASTYSGHVIVCGMGKVGYRVTQELLKLDREVVAIEANDGGRFVEKAKSLGIPVIIADARRTENIIKAGVLQAAAIIPCTDNELTNLDIALDAREINPHIKVVMRMFDPDLARRVEKGFGIHTALSTSALAAPVFAAASLNMNVKSSFYLEDQLLNVGEQTIQPGAPIEGWSIQKLENELDLTVISYCKDAELRLHPEPDLILNPGIKILVLASLETLHRLTEKNRPR